MSEFELHSLFNTFLISNAIFFAGNAFLLWVAFRASLGVRDNGGNMLTKILVSLFGLGIVFVSLQMEASCKLTGNQLPMLLVN